MKQQVLNLREAIAGLPINLRYVNRFSTSRCIRPENVAEHSYYVCLYGWMLVRVAIQNLELLPESARALTQEVLEKAVLHDIEECRTGDIHRPFKYSHPELKQALDQAADIAVEQICERLFTPEGPDHPRRLVYVWKTSKDDSLSGKILRLADFLSVLSFVMQEGADAPKRLCLETMREHFGQFWHEEWDEQGCVRIGRAQPGFEWCEAELQVAANLMREVFNA